MRYFHIMTGLRGCYMPDSVYMIAVKTRREVKAALESEAQSIRDSWAGCSKRAIAELAAGIWRDKKAGLPYCSPYGPRGKYPPYGLMIGNATRAEWLEYLKESGNE